MREGGGARVGCGAHHALSSENCKKIISFFRLCLSLICSGICG